MRGLLGGLFIGVLLGILLSSLVLTGVIKLPGFPPDLIIPAVLGLLIATALHEAGHVIGGALTGFKPLVLAVGPMRFQREGSRWRLRWLWRSKALGFVVLDPRGEHNLTRRLMFMVASGPAMSALAGVMAAGLASIESEHRWTAAELNLVALWSVAAAVTSFLPSRGRLMVNDGTRLRMLRKGGEDAERFCTMILLAASLRSQQRPRDWNRDLIDRLQGGLDASPDALAAQTVRYNFLLDSGRLDEAQQVLAWMVGQKLPRVVQAIWWLQAASFQARFRGDVASAQEWLNRAPLRLSTPEGRCAYCKAQAEIALLEGRWPDAEAASREAIKACARMADIGTTRAIRERMEEICNRAAAAKIGD